MVRIKHRYLLVNILYPDTKGTAKATILKPNDSVPYTVQFRQPSSDKLDARLLMQMIRNGVSELFGDYGSGMVAPSLQGNLHPPPPKQHPLFNPRFRPLTKLQVKYFSPATSTAIIRVSRDHYRLVWATLAFITRLPRPVDQLCVLQVVRVSGTIKKAEEEAVRRARLSIRRARKAAVKANEPTVGMDAVTGATDEVEGDGMGFASGIEDDDEVGHEDESD